MSTLASLPVWPEQDPERRWRRRIWNVVYVLFFRPSFHNWYGFRRWLLVLFGAKLDPTSQVRPSVRIDRPWNLTMGRKSSLGDHCEIWALAPITIGSRTVCSQYSILCTWFIDTSKEKPIADIAPIDIGSDVWIAAETVVTGKATIDDGALIGARSNATGHIEGWMIHSGAPLRTFRERPYTDDSEDGD